MEFVLAILLFGALVFGIVGGLQVSQHKNYARGIPNIGIALVAGTAVLILAAIVL